ncbi:MAG TPA: thioredoxin family protein [Terriglobia bacterium]|nr:thioredoxin family protein [Terriglobia bacterium]
MLSITVFGPGCARCKETERIVRQVVEQSGTQAELEKISDPMAMAKAGVLLTPAVAVNGVLKTAGRIPSESEIRSWIAAG